MSLDFKDQDAVRQEQKKYLEYFRDADDMRLLECPGCSTHIAVQVSELNSFDIDCDCGTTFAHDTYKGRILTVSGAIASIS
ncbi:hypothetical protein LCGC14_1600180 [marine sediment metagenome]|uniref:Uncharacterized protein n=1 Tax=marine sediment metagenome TaxID=412755 RepID=A0A0F9IXV6_9ZZZZ